MTIYIGQGKTKMLQFGDIIKCSICVTDIPKEHIKTSKNGKKYINFDLCQRKEVDAYGNTHCIKLDTWTPDASKEDIDDIPF